MPALCPLHGLKPNANCCGPEQEYFDWGPPAPADDCGPNQEAPSPFSPKPEEFDWLIDDAQEVISPPLPEKSVEILESWYPSAKQLQYRIIINDKVVINKNMEQEDKESIKWKVLPSDLVDYSFNSRSTIFNSPGKVDTETLPGLEEDEDYGDR